MRVKCEDLSNFYKSKIKENCKELFRYWACTHENKTLNVLKSFDIHEITEVTCCDCGKVIKSTNKALRDTLTNVFGIGFSKDILSKIKNSIDENKK